jgi:hypothetical protein
MRLSLLLLLSLAGSLQGQIKPWIEVGLGSARDRTPCPSCHAPGEAARIAARISVGAGVTPNVGLGLAIDHGLHPNIIDGQGAYSVMSALAEVVYPREPALRGRAGLGWAFSSTPDDEQGQGLALRLGGGLQVPRASAAAVIISIDYFHAVTGQFRRVSSYNPRVPPTSSFDFRMVQLALSLRVGARYPRRP